MPGPGEYDPPDSYMSGMPARGKFSGVISKGKVKSDMERLMEQVRISAAVAPAAAVSAAAALRGISDSRAERNRAFPWRILDRGREPVLTGRHAEGAGEGAAAGGQGDPAAQELPKLIKRVLHVSHLKIRLFVPPCSLNFLLCFFSSSVSCSRSLLPCSRRVLGAHALQQLGLLALVLGQQPFDVAQLLGRVHRLDYHVKG